MSHSRSPTVSSLADKGTTGRYTPAAITTIITNLIKAFSATFPYACLRDDRALPSLLAFKPIPLSIISTLQALPKDLHLEQDVITYLQDVTFISLPSSASAENGAGSVKYARLFNDYFDVDEADRDRLTRRMKAELLLTGSSASDPSVEIVQLHCLNGISPLTPIPAPGKQDSLSLSPHQAGSAMMTSPAHSDVSLATTETDQTYVSDADLEPEAVTPELFGSLVLEPGIRMDRGDESRSGSLENPVEGKPTMAGVAAGGLGGAINHAGAR